MTEWYADYYLGQAPLHAPSVFNFFSPAYQPTGEASDQGLVAPELQLATDFMLPTTHDALGDQVFWYYVGNPQTSADEHQRRPRPRHAPGGDAGSADRPLQRCCSCPDRCRRRCARSLLAR